MFRNPFNDFFYWCKADRRAILALMCIAVFGAGVVCVVGTLEGDSFVASQNVVKEDDKIFGDGGISYGLVNGGVEEIHEFDPNLVDSATLISFGIKPYKVSNFLHYRAAGKIFRSVDDLAKTYGWDEEDIALLAPYIWIDEQRIERIMNERYSYRRTDVRRGGVDRQEGDVGDNYARDNYADAGTGENGNIRIDVYDDINGNSAENVIAVGRDGSSSHTGMKKYDKFSTLTVVDANSVDSVTLRRIPGIGEKICKAIIKYRDRLGGFYDERQLLEIKIFSPELLSWFDVDDRSSLRKIKVNEASFQVLNSHPYIKYEQAKELLQYIRLYGLIRDERTLATTGIFSVDEMEKLKPYLDYGK